MKVKVSFYKRKFVTTFALVALAFLTLTGVSQAARHVISSLPYTFSAGSMTNGQVDTLVLGSRRLRSATNGITLAAEYNNRLHDVVLDLGNDTISFGEGGGNGNVGVRITGTSTYFPYNVKVVGGYILHNPSDTTADGNSCLDIRGNDLLIENVHATVRGYNGVALYAAGSNTYNVEISGGVYHSDVTAFTSRCDYDAPVIKLTNLYSSDLQASGALYHFDVHDVTINGGPHMGIAVMGREGNNDFALAKIHNCNIMTDARNDFYLSYDGLCHSTSNPYGIVIRHAEAGCEIYNNTITSGTRYGGNRGILVEYGRGTPAKPIHIYGNYVDVHEGPNVEYGDGLPCHGLRIRYSPQEFVVEDNTFIVSGDNNSSTTWTGVNVNNVRITDTQNPYPLAHIVLRRNTIISRALSSSGVDVQGVMFDAISYDSVVWMEHNHIISSGHVYQYGFDNGESHGQVIIGDTVEFDNSIRVNPRTYYVGYLGNAWTCTHNAATDVVYQGGTSYDDIAFSSGGTGDISIRKTLNVTVRGNNNSVVPGATVTIRNAYNHQVATGLTNSAGQFSAAVTYFYQSRTGTDSASFNNFTITAQKDADQSSQTVAVSPTTAGIQLTLSGTAGNTDTTPPGQINDLGAVTGSGDGKINLSWTASGDDGSSGTATFYSIKYSTSAITSANFDAITDSAASPPTPAVSGTAQSTVLANLTPDTRYYVAIKVYDDGMNPSSLSNVASAISSSSIPSGTTDSIPPGQINDLGAVTGSSEGRINLSWTASGDDGTSGTAMLYSIKFSTSNITTANFDAIADSVTNPPTPAISGTDQSTVLTNLTPGTRYYVAIKAYDDGMNPSPLSNVVSAVSGAPIPSDTVVTEFVPNDGATVNSTHPVLSARNIPAAGTNAYYFEVSENASFNRLVTSSPAVPQSNQNYTTWEIDSALATSQPYYWRVKVNDYPYSDAVQFTVGATSEYVAYPNPVSFNQGESVTFILPAGPVDLLIQSPSGETVLHPTSLSGQYVWDGKNASGNTVSVGIYLWYIEGTSYKGKIVNIP